MLLDELDMAVFIWQRKLCVFRGLGTSLASTRIFEESDGLVLVFSNLLQLCFFLLKMTAHA